MKRTCFLMALAAILIISCQPKSPTTQVDLNAAKAAATAVLDKFYEGIKARDVNAVNALWSEDLLYCGTDPKEFWTRTESVNVLNQMLADTSVKMVFPVDKRELRVTKDGNSAFALDQSFAPFISNKMQLRFIYHLVKESDKWLIDFVSVSFIPANKDIAKLNKALE